MTIHLGSVLREFISIMTGILQLLFIKKADSIVDGFVIPDTFVNDQKFIFNHLNCPEVEIPKLGFRWAQPTCLRNKQVGWAQGSCAWSQALYNSVSERVLWALGSIGIIEEALGAKGIMCVGCTFLGIFLEAAEHIYSSTCLWQCCLYLEKKMATHSSILAWKIPWMEEPGGLLSMGLKIVGHDWATSLLKHYIRD